MDNTEKYYKNSPEYELEILKNKLAKQDLQDFEIISEKIKKYRYAKYFKKVLPSHLIAFILLIIFINLSNLVKFGYFDVILIFIMILLSSFIFISNKKEYQFIWINYLMKKDYIKVDELNEFRNPLKVIERVYDYLKIYTKNP